MEKFSLHESLRIYLPGLLLAGIFYFIVNLTLKDIQLILLPAIFVGILLNSIIWNFHAKTYKKLNDTYPLKVSQQYMTFLAAWKEIIHAKMEKSERTDLNHILFSENSSEVAEFVVRSYFSKRFELIELNYFRSPKSFGVMCYNLAFVCKASIVLAIGFGIYESGKMRFTAMSMMPYLMITVVLILSHFLFMRNSRQYFVESLNREIQYWKSISKTEISEVNELVELWQKLNLTSKPINTNAQHGISAIAAEE